MITKFDIDKAVILICTISGKIKYSLNLRLCECVKKPNQNFVIMYAFISLILSMYAQAHMGVGG